LTPHVLVCPCHEPLLRRLAGRKLVLRVTSAQEMADAIRYSQQYNLQLHCFWFTTPAPLAALVLQPEHRDKPLALYVSELGPFPEFIKRLPELRDMNLRVYLPTGSRDNYTNLRILSSLGIASAVVLREPEVDWENLSDLMTYALLGLAPHAPIEPFQFTATHYDCARQTDFSAVYFADPCRYLHVNEQGCVALTPEELEAQNFILEDVQGLDAVEEHEAYIRRLEAWRDFFLAPEGCAYCQGWRVCLGKFRFTADSNPGCKAFFAELIEAAEQYQALQNQQKSLWLP